MLFSSRDKNSDMTQDNENCETQSSDSENLVQKDLSESFDGIVNYSKDPMLIRAKERLKKTREENPVGSARQLKRDREAFKEVIEAFELS